MFFCWAYGKQGSRDDPKGEPGCPPSEWRLIYSGAEGMLEAKTKVLRGRLTAWVLVPQEGRGLPSSSLWPQGVLPETRKWEC